MRHLRTIIALVALLIATASASPQSRVQIGYCTGLNNVAAAKGAGFDYVELSTTEAPELKVEFARPEGSTAQFEVVGGS